MFIRTVKFVLSALAAILLAQALGLQHAVTAGIVALLSITDSRRSTVRVAWERFVSIVLALAVAIVVFNFLGYDLVAFAFFLVITVPLFDRLRITTGLVPSAVLITQMMAQQSLAGTLIINQLVIFLIGAGMAFIANSYMPSHSHKIKRAQQAVDQQIQLLFIQIEQYLLGNTAILAEGELERASMLLHEGMETVLKEQNNQLFAQTTYELHYLEMRQAQLQLLKQIYHYLEQDVRETPESKVLAGLFFLAAYQLHEYNSAVYLMENIQDLYRYYRERPLPQTRAEFEQRALLFQLLNDFKRVIQIKVEFYMEYQQEQVRRN